MQIFSTPGPIKVFISEQRNQGKSIGLVPTMGALHRGHMELVKQSVKTNDATVCSIYVNPVQFNDKQDLTSYPRALDEDFEKLTKAGCQAVYCPSDDIMYPQQPKVGLKFGHFESVMEGLYRPGHFNGVALVVTKLFNMIPADRAYFGEKDWQQLSIIRQLVKDLNFPLEIVGIPTVREKDGLAMSSRNLRLSPDHRKVAGSLYQSIVLVKEHLEQTRNIDSAKQVGIDYLDQFGAIRVEYLEVVSSDTLEPPANDIGSQGLSVCVAAFIGKVRLIDNVKVFTNP